MLKHSLLLFILVATGCTIVPKTEIDAADAYLFPHFKTIAEPEFALTPAERAKAIQEWRKEVATAFIDGVLYEVIVDGQGSVVKIRAVQPYPKDDAEQYFTAAFRQSIQGRKFRPDNMPTAYRTFYYPMLIKSVSHPLNEP